MGKNTLAKGVNKAPTLTARIDAVCERLRIPDLRTRSGLRKIHRSFPDIYQRLSSCYRDNAEQDAVKGTIITIYARMCTDSLLRDKLFNEGFLSQIMPLLNVSPYTSLVLQCLVTITHHGGKAARQFLAAYTPRLVKLAQDNVEDPLITEQCIVITAHCAICVLCPQGGKLDNSLFKSLGSLESLFKLVWTVLHRPATTHQTFIHAVELLTAAPEYGRAAFLSHPPSNTFLVACLRSADIQTRAAALGGLLRMDITVSEPDRTSLDPQKFLKAVQRPQPPAVNDTLVRYGSERTDTYAFMSTSLQYQKALMKYAQDHDLYSLGMQLVQLIGRTEYSIADGMFQDEKGKIVDLGLPFVHWMDALPHCANAIRKRGDPAQRDAANIVELKFLVLKSRMAEACPIALEALKSSPNVAFYYYVLTMGSEHADGLRWAKKGLKCTGPWMTPYVRFGLLFYALEHAGLLGLQILEQATRGERAVDEGHIFLKCALEDSKTYIAEAPPDSRHMCSAILWCTLLSTALRGPELSLDLREIQGLLDKQQVSDEIKAFVHSAPVSKTQFRLARQNILKHYASAAAEWSPVISRFGSMEPSEPPSQALVVSRSPAEELADWSDGSKLDNESDEPKMYCVHPQTGGKPLELWRCSHCGNPSAMLKKCTGCMKTRYCDAPCQKAHWTEHKKVCKPHVT
ncbi:hypothetical protein JB92DRAFT_2970109 [Gautieria morchelliformis]|nr:hypothetical protein JB92DRAFT_2970109 [Gautieria morchelliformis]